MKLVTMHKILMGTGMVMMTWFAVLSFSRFQVSSEARDLAVALASSGAVAGMGYYLQAFAKKHADKAQ